jgi:hypothetical protein
MLRPIGSRRFFIRRRGTTLSFDELFLDQLAEEDRVELRALDRT